MNKTLASSVMIALAALLVMASGGHAQDGSLVTSAPTPRVGHHTLAAGFTPPLFSVAIQAGGVVSVDGMHLGPGCRGLVDRQPDYLIDWSGRTAQLRFFVRSAVDVTLILRDPMGRFRCNDDASPGTELQPLIDVFRAPAGQYAVWVGTKTPGPVSTQLFVTEDHATEP